MSIERKWPLKYLRKERDFPVAVDEVQLRRGGGLVDSRQTVGDTAASSSTGLCQGAPHAEPLCPLSSCPLVPVDHVALTLPFNTFVSVSAPSGPGWTRQEPHGGEARGGNTVSAASQPHTEVQQSPEEHPLMSGAGGWAHGGGEVCAESWSTIGSLKDRQWVA